MVEKVGMSENRAMEISGHKRAPASSFITSARAPIFRRAVKKVDKWMKAQRSDSAKKISEKIRKGSKGTSSRYTSL
jgi:hypothetical protein